ncbi:hypothetical protein HPB52_021299 [Rhipicephalus sanguineus]|uniref:Uncharacterized protein n=1 Tax=Rhipicephalus sanguineus TaxID=34632 RepID=A0A9D4Q3S0_RHISA|nr:hypothetical protein HPB52_021299 [Rhipicephalus sanguineus]
MYDDCLRSVCGWSESGRPPLLYKEWTRTRYRVTEYLWNVVHPTLPRKKKVASQQKVVVLGDAVLEDEEVRKTMELGPKFCFEPRLKAAEALAMGRVVADRVPEAEKARCIAECAGVISTASHRPQLPFRAFVTNTRVLVDYFVERKIGPLVADK